MLPTTSLGARSMVAKTGVAPVRIAATRHRPRNQLSRGSLTTSSGLTCEVALQPLGGQDPLRLAGGDPAGLEPRLGPRVADLDQRLLEQPVVVVDHPARLAEPLGVGLVGDHLGLGHVQAHDPHQPGHRAGAAAAGAGDEQHLARVRRRVGQAQLVAGSARPVAHGGTTSVRGTVAPMLAERRPVAAERRGAGVRRGGLPAGLPRHRAAPDRLARPTALEVVVVDDGSPDESGAIAESYAARDPRVRVVHTENRGLGAARNEGLRHVTGDYLAFADSDDVVPADGVRRPGRVARRAPARTS